MIRVFDLNRPGRNYEERPTSKTRKSKIGQRGILSCITFNPDYSGMYAVGSYAKSTVIYSEKDGSQLCELWGQAGGLTHLQFSADGKYLCTGGRKDSNIFCWDIRQTGKVLHKFKRHAPTNQRIYFDIRSDGKFIATGSADGKLLVYDMKTGECIEKCTLVFKDSVNSLSFRPYSNQLCVATGQRHFEFAYDCSSTSSDDGDDQSETRKLCSCNEVSLWEIS